MKLEIFRTIQLLATVVAFVTTIYMMRRKATFEQKLWLIISVCILLHNLLYFMQLGAADFESAVIYARLARIALAYLGFLYLVFIIRYLGRNVSKIIYRLEFFNCTMVVVANMFDRFEGYFFDFTGLTFVGGLPCLEYNKGVWYYVDLGWTIVVLMYGFSVTISTFTMTRDKDEKKRIKALLLAVVIVALTYPLCELLMPEGFSVFPIILSLISITMIVMVEKYNLVDIVATAREISFDSMREVILIFDEKLRLKDINRSGRELFPDIAASMGSILPENYSFLFDRTGEKLSFKHNGHHFDRHFSPIYVRDRLTGYNATLIEVTESHEMMLQMRKLQHQAEAANEAKNSFLANMSHEIRTPMNAIVGYADLIGHEVTTGEGREYAQAIKNSSNGLLHIINDILDFSKIEQGNLELVEEEYYTESLFREVCDILSVQTDRKNLKLISSVEPTTPAILYGDKMRLRQIIMNVANNAVKFTAEGSIRIVSEWEECDPGRATLTIIVSDTGVGIRKDDMSKLFSEFERFDMTRKYKDSGTGLGLVIAKELLEMMGGTISLESEYGVGTSVIITVKQQIIDSTPISALGREKKETEKKEESFAAPDAKILVVDDNRVNLELMNSYLKQFRIIPELVESGEESVEKAKKNDYDIIFMDQMMPGMDGVTAMKTIRELGGRFEKLPIIALTANALAGTRTELIGEGFTDYASKPLPIKTLEYLLSKYLPSGSYMLSENSMGDKEIGSVAELMMRQQKKLKLPDYIDTRVGMSNSGNDPEQYRKVIEIVYKYTIGKTDHIRELLEKEDYKNYTIEVHSAKSNAATVGAMHVSELALELETAGRTGDIDTIKAKSENFFEQFEQLNHDLKICLEGEEDDAPGSVMMGADTEEYHQTFEEISSAIREGRMSDAMDLFGVLDFFELPPVIAHTVSDMKSLAEAKDWQAVLNKLSQLGGQL